MPLKPFQIRYLGYWLLVAMLVLVGALHLSTPLLTVLFSYFLLTKLRFGRGKLLPVVVFIICMLGMLYTSGYYVKQAVDALPRIIDETLPRFAEFANENGLDLPVEDIHELKTEAVKYMKAQLGYLGNFAKIASRPSVATSKWATSSPCADRKIPIIPGPHR